MNPFDLLKNPAALKDQLSKVQSEMENITATGSAGGGIVKVTVNGKFQMLDIFLDPIAVDPRDIKMLQDLIVAAHHMAVEEVQQKMQQGLGSLTGGFNFPGF